MPPIFPNVGQIHEEWPACLYTPLSAIGLSTIPDYQDDESGNPQKILVTHNF